MGIVQYIVGMQQSIRSRSLGGHDLTRLFFWKTIAVIYAFDLDGLWNIYNQNTVGLRFKCRILNQKRYIDNAVGGGGKLLFLMLDFV